MISSTFCETSAINNHKKGYGCYVNCQQNFIWASVLLCYITFLQAKSEELKAKVDKLLKEKFAHRDDEVGLRIVSFTLKKFLEGSAFMK